MRDKTIGTGIGDVLSIYCPGCKQRPVVGNELKGSNLVAAGIPAAEAAEQSLVRFRRVQFVIINKSSCRIIPLLFFHPRHPVFYPLRLLLYDLD